MAINLRRLCRLNISLANNILLKPSFINVGRRSLYSERDIGVTAYENTRFTFRNQFMTIEDTFRSKMKELCEQERGAIYTEDLKAMLHLVQDTDEDMDLLIKMLEKYVQLKHEQKLGTYVFGPVVMRMFYYLNQPQRALAAFENNILSSSFYYRSSFRTLMCLLYKHSMYKEMRSVFDKILHTKGIDFIGHNSVLIYASCLKENTQESFEYALDIWKKEFNTARPSMRSTSMMAYLSIKNNASETALEILSLADRERTMSIKSLKILAYMNLKRYLQIIPILKQVVEPSDSTFKLLLFADVIYELEEKVNTESVVEKEDLLKLIRILKSQNQLDSQFTLEEFLFKPIILVHKNVMPQRELKFRNRIEPQHDKIGLKNYL
ncbi:Pentatricopeptide repeat-containing protein 2, mitochondrial [Anthophora quadrimaculata]